MWNLEKWTDEPISKARIEKQVKKLGVWTRGRGGEKGRVGRPGRLG